MTIYILVVLSCSGTSLFFRVQFLLLLPDLHTDCSRGRSGDLVFPSLSEFSTVYCDPHSQRLWHSQSRNRCFSGNLLLFRWSYGCNTSPSLSWKHHYYWSLFTPWLYNRSLSPGRFHRVHTNPDLFLHLDSYFYHFLPLDMRLHIMILLLLSLLLLQTSH